MVRQAEKPSCESPAHLIRRHYNSSCSSCCDDCPQDEVTPPIEPTPRTVSRRKPLPEHLPREIHVHQPESQCSGCGGTFRQLGEDVSEVLEYVPARFKVIRHVRPKRVCNCCEHITQVPAPSRPIARGLAGPGLLAHVLVSKFVDPLPLYRQSEIY
jgi:transposase